MFCKNCGTEIDNEAKFCISCGAAISNSTAETIKQSQGQIPNPNNSNVDFNKNAPGLNVLSFLIPIVGLVLYAVFYNTEPIKANGVGKWALIGVVTGTISYLIISGCAASMY